MSRYPDAGLQAYVFWAPILSGDSRSTAIQATAYLPDPRVQHIWDPWSFSVKLYSEQLNYPPDDIAWDVFVLYEPKLEFGDGPPSPTVWMQHRGLDIGLKYSQALFEAELRKLLR